MSAAAIRRRVPGTNTIEARTRDVDAEKIALRRHRYAQAIANIETATLGDLLDQLVYADGLNDDEPFERRALGTVANWFNVLSFCREGIPSGVLYQLEMMTKIFAELGARLEQAGPIDPCIADGSEPTTDDEDDEPEASS